MSTMSKTLVAVLAGILVGGAAYVMAAPAEKNTAKTTPAAAPTTRPATISSLARGLARAI